MPPASNFGQDITNTTPNSDGGELNRNVLQNIERMGGTLLIPRVAGKGVIKVVKRCDDAKENNELGKFRTIFFSSQLIFCCRHFEIYFFPHFRHLYDLIERH